MASSNEKKKKKVCDVELEVKKTEAVSTTAHLCTSSTDFQCLVRSH